MTVNASLISIVQGACPVTLGLGGITEGQKLLVRRCRVGGWTVLECLNCHLLTHATRGRGGDVAASTLLIVSVCVRGDKHTQEDGNTHDRHFLMSYSKNNKYRDQGREL